MTPESLKKSWEGAIRSIGAHEFTIAFRRWLDQCKVHLAKRRIHEKSYKINTLLTIIAVFLLMFFNLILNALCT